MKTARKEIINVIKGEISHEQEYKRTIHKAKQVFLGENMYYVCPNCNTFFDSGMYCSECGIRLEK